MDLIGYAIDWCRGEIFEGNMAFLYGTVILIVSMAFWKIGQTPYAKGVTIPLALVAILFMTGGFYLHLQNNNRIIEYREACTVFPRKSGDLSREHSGSRIENGTTVNGHP